MSLTEKSRTVILSTRKVLIDVIHHDNDPAIWIVRKWIKRLLLPNRRTVTYRFLGREQAFDCAHLMKGEVEGRERVALH